MTVEELLSGIAEPSKRKKRTVAEENMITIKRIRYVVVNNHNEIFCGLARHYTFKPIDDLGDTAIKTYLSEKKAKSSFLSSWYDSKEEDFKDGTFRVVRVIESLTESEENNNG